MNYIRSDLVKMIVFIFLLLFIVYPSGAAVIEDNVSENSLLPGIDGFLSGIVDFFYDISGNENGKGGSGPGGNDILATIEKINLVKYEDNGIDGDIGEYIKENINDSISQEIFDGKSALQRDLYILIAESRSYPEDFTLDGYEIFLYPLVMDDDLGSPSFLSRPSGLKITLYVYSISEPGGRTIRVYEKYSTDIIREIYGGGYGDEFGTIYLKFVDMDSGEEILHMTLDAADAENYRESWDNPGSYIGIDGWSDLKINDDYGIAYYEDIANRISLEPDDSYIAGIDQENESDSYDETVISYDLLLVNSVSGSYDRLVSMLDEIGRYCDNGERDQVLGTANDLGDYLFTLKTSVKEIPVSAVLSMKKIQYLDALEKISDAASDYWHFSVYYDSASLSSASENSDAGLTMLNSLMEDIGGTYVDPGQLNIPSEKNTLTDSFSLFNTFHYRDSSGSNDISLKVENWNLKNNLLTKNIYNGEQETIPSEYNTKFLVVTVVFTHLGYRGGGPEQIVTPAESSFKLQYNGNEYSPQVFDEYLENSGEPYRSKKVDRREIYESVLVFKIDIRPDQAFDDKEAYLSVNLGDYGVQTWNLEKPDY